MEGFTKIGNVWVQNEIFTTYFSCDYEKCGGACCWANIEGVEMDGGVVSPTEAIEIRKNRSELAKYCAVENMGKAITKPVYLSGARHCVSFNGKGECIYMSREKKTCVLKLAHVDGKLSFDIPQMCGLYPLWVQHKRGETFLYLENLFDDYCKDAYEKGKREDKLVFRFCEKALVRVFGEDFYESLCEMAFMLHLHEDL